MLSACFYSETALYPESAGACPVRAATEYAVTQVDAGGRTARLGAFTLSPDGAHCAYEGAGAGPGMGAMMSRDLFVPFENGWHIVQRGQVGDESRFTFQLARIQGNRIEFYTPSCADFTAAALEEMNIEATDLSQGMPGMEEPGAEEPRGPRVPPQHPKQAGPGAGPDAPPLMCNVRERAQLEAAFRAWIRLGRPPSEYGERE
jgi:hypothetical protein